MFFILQPIQIVRVEVFFQTTIHSKRLALFIFKVFVDIEPVMKCVPAILEVIENKTYIGRGLDVENISTSPVT